MKKPIIIAIMLFAMQAQAVTVVVPHITVAHIVATPHVSTSSHLTSSHITTTTPSASKMTNTAKTITQNVIKPNQIIEAQGSKEVTSKTTPVGSLNSSVKSFGCEVPKVEKKVEKPKCDK